MTDPKFTTREELSEWIAQQMHEAKLALLDTIRRVTLAHGHLFEEAK